MADINYVDHTHRDYFRGGRSKEKVLYNITGTYITDCSIRIMTDLLEYFDHVLTTSQSPLPHTFKV